MGLEKVRGEMLRINEEEYIFSLHVNSGGIP
jgi:hypothetical protein